METPICLIEVTPSGGILLNEDGLQILRSQDNSLEVVAMFGHKDTGKSLLMNQVLGTTDGFHLSELKASTNPGIWMRYLPHPIQKGHGLLLLDTDGFIEEEDQKSFALLFLLDILTCSVFIYNTRATLYLLDELTDLKYMTELTRMVCVDASFPENTSLLLQGILPEFVCCMRDVPADPLMEQEMLDTRHSLDAALRQDEDAETPILGYKLFPKRKLFHFCHPWTADGDHDTETTQQNQLDPFFQGQASRFWDYILSCKTKTTLGNRAVNGRILACFLERYVDLLNLGEVIVLSDLNDIFMEDIDAFQQLDFRRSSEKEELACQRITDVHQQAHVFTPSYSQIREAPQTSYKPVVDFTRSSEKEEVTFQKITDVHQQSPVFTPSYSQIREAPQTSYKPLVDFTRSSEKEEVTFQKITDVHQQSPVFTPSYSQIREAPQTSYKPLRETLVFSQTAALPWPSPDKCSIRPNMAGIPTMDAPICLIENMPGGDLQVNQCAVNILCKINHPVVVVAIVGLYRTGKSYLMNKLAEKRTGFSLGSTIQSHTKGIWMWCVPHPVKPDQTLVLLDTEGLGDVEKGDSKNDSWIFALSVLLSSTFVYNSMGTIDYKAMEQLHYVTELTERIKVRSTRTEDFPDDEDSDFMSFFPAFVWTVRDFTLDLVLNGHDISEDEYLENALKLSPDAEANTNMPKQYIRRYFPTRKCFVFDRPTSKRNLAVIETLQEAELEPDFVEQAQKFCCYIHKNAKTKTIKGGHIVTGTLLANLAVTYVDAIRSGTIPCMENAVLALAQIENSAAVQEAIAQYMKGMEMAEREQFPTETMKEFMFVHNACEKEALQVFLNRSFKDDDQVFLEELARQVEAKCEDFRQRNDQASSDHCMALLLEDKESIEDLVSQGFYAKAGGYQLYIDAQRQMVDHYNFMPGKGLKAEQVLHDVLKSQETMVQTILQMDIALTQKEKEAAEEKARAEALAREAQMKQEILQQTQQMLEYQQRAHEEHTQQLQQKMKEDREKLLQEQDMVLSRKLQEQQCLLQEGFNNESARLGGEIQRLKNQIPPPRSPPRRRKCVIS